MVPLGWRSRRPVAVDHGEDRLRIPLWADLLHDHLGRYDDEKFDDHGSGRRDSTTNGINGQHYETPVYELLGGRVRSRARAYGHVFGATRAELVEGVVAAKEAGFTAVGHLTPFLDEPFSEPYFEMHVQKVRGAVDAVRRYREAVGDTVDLCIEIHRRLAPAEAVQVALGIEQYHPMFIEDPVLPDDVDELASSPTRSTSRSRRGSGSPAPRRSPHWPRPATSASSRTIR